MAKKTVVENPLIRQLVDEARIMMAAAALIDGRTTQARNLKRWASMMALAATDLRSEVQS